MIPTRTTPRTAAAALLALALVLVLTGCSDDEPTGPSPQASASPSPSGDPDLAALEALPVLAEVDGLGPALGLTAEVVGLERTKEGPVVARLRVTKREQEASLSALDNTDYLGIDVGNARLLDEVNLQAGLPLATPEGRCLCSELPSLDVGESAAVFVTFPAPAPDAVVALALESFPTTAPLPLEDTPSGTALSQEPGSAAYASAEETTRPLALRSGAVDDSRRTSVEGETVTVDVASDVLFAFGEATLTPEAQSRLDAVAEELRASAQGSVAVVGHTDSVGDDASNQALSERRANAVRDALQSRTTGTSLTFEASGRGEQEPVAEERGPDREQAAALNRRVTVSYALTEQAQPSAAPPSAGPSAPQLDPDAPALGSATATGAPLELEVLSLRRQGVGMVQGRFRLTNTGSSSLPLTSDFAERPLSARSLPVFDGVRLVDPAAGIAYKVVIDDEPLCLCTRLTTLDGGDATELTATFAAPPEGVTTVDVTLPGFETPISGVRLS